MAVLRITNGFDKLNDADLEVKANSIIASMTEFAATYFPTPSPTIAYMQTVLTDFTNALTKAKTGSSLDKDDKNQKREVLISNLHLLSAYVLFASGGNALIAKASGYSVAKAPIPGAQVLPATNQKVEDGVNSGEIKYSFDKVPGAKSYLYQYTADPVTPNSVWTGQPGTVRKTVFTGLEVGKRYWFRVLAIGTNGQGAYSDAVSRIVQ